MAKQVNPNIEILTVAVDKLGPLKDEMVFLGGVRHRPSGYRSRSSLGTAYDGR